MSGTICGIPTRRIVRLATVAAPVGLVITLLILWLIDQWGQPPFWRAGLFLMAALESAYLAAVVGAVVSLPILSVLIVCGRRRGARRPLAARAC